MDYMFPIGSNFRDTLDENNLMTHYHILRDYKQQKNISYNYKDKYYEYEIESKTLSEPTFSITNKNLKYIKKWLRSQNDINCYSLSDNLKFFLQDYVNKDKLEALNEQKNEKTYYKKLSKKTRDFIYSRPLMKITHQIDYINRRDSITRISFSKTLVEKLGVKKVGNFKSLLQICDKQKHANWVSLWLHKLTGLKMNEFCYLYKGLDRPEYIDLNECRSIDKDGKKMYNKMINWKERYTQNMKLYEVSYSVMI